MISPFSTWNLPAAVPLVGMVQLPVPLAMPLVAAASAESAARALPGPGIAQKRDLLWAVPAEQSPVVGIVGVVTLLADPHAPAVVTLPDELPPEELPLDLPLLEPACT